MALERVKMVEINNSSREKIKQQAEAAYQFDGCCVSHGYSVCSAYIIIELYYLVDNRGGEMERENVEMKI